ncbi:MAG: metallophosphoesterase, partial [Tabrizicola sp.]
MYQGPVAPVVKSLTPKDSEADGALPSATAILSATSRHACASLRLIATSDLHASLMPYDYCADRPNSSLGLDAIALQIAEARGEARNCLLFDNGDFLQGSPLADYAAASRRRRAHPMITAFNTLGYDAATLGNHEFDYGLRFLSGVLADARFPVVSANIATRLGKSPSRDATLVPPFAILRRQIIDHDGRAHLLRIGVIGFAPPQIAEWDRNAPDGSVQTRDILAAARAWVPRLRARGADIIVALAHTGIGEIEPEDGTENAATALAALREIDALVAGHSHQVFPGPDFPASTAIDPVRGRLAGKPAVMPGHSANHVGIIDLQIERCASG